MTNTNELTAKLKAAAQKATALNLDTAQVKRGNDGYLECPCCEGAGYVEEENDFCNIDGVALGVQFYGIGQHHGLAEEYLRAASPENVLALTEALEDAEKRIAGYDRQCDEQYLLGMATGWNFGLVEDCDGYDATYASRRKLIDAERDAGIKLQIEGE